MRYLAVVPGIFGVSMTTPIKQVAVTVWPPGETNIPISTQDLVGFLTDAATRPGEVLRDAPCTGAVYGNLLTTLGDAPGTRVIEVPYDWRLDLGTAARDLADRLPTALEAGDEIVIVAHSMGGLVTRWLLESGEFADRPWFAKIAKAIFIATPHRGAPLALFRIRGESALVPVILPGWAMKSLASDPKRYPSGYQLLPAPDENVVDDAGSVEDLFHSPAMTGLDAEGIAAVRRLHTKIAAMGPPGHVEYHLLFGTGLETVSRIRIDAAGVPAPVLVVDGGDGTVPSWSACPAGLKATSTHSFRADHVGILSSPGATACVQWLVENRGPPHDPALPEGLELSSTWPVVALGDRVQLLLSVNGEPRPIAGDLVCRDQTGAEIERLRIASGAPTTHIPLRLSLPPKPGVYLVNFIGQPRALTGALRLTVVDAAEMDRLGLASAPSV